MPECIHGLEIPLCDSCYPKAVVEKPKVARSSSPRTPKGGPVVTRARTIDPNRQRVYHLTHISNLESILLEGEIRADASAIVDLSTPLARELRATAEVAPGSTVARHVPFYLAPTAVLWTELVAGAHDETRWSAAARSAASADFVVLVSTVGALGADAIITDGDAAGSVTRFAAGDETKGMLVRLHDTESADSAEVLAPISVSLDAIQLIGVANDPVRERVRDLTSIRVAVYPPWFQVAE